MAQLIVPISSYANGNALTTGDWGNPITRSGTTLTVAGTAPNKTLAIFGNVAGTKIFNYIPVNGVNDIEILVKFRFSSDFGKEGIAMLRYTGSSEATTAGYAVSGSFISSAGQLAIDEGATGYLFWAPWNYLANVTYWVRFRVNGNNQYAKVWTDGSTEPAGWTTAGTDSHKPSGTYNGIHTYSINNTSSATVTYYFISFGTNGDTAPGIQATMTDVAHAHNLESVTLTQKHTLVVDDISHAHGLESAGDLVHNIGLSVDDLQHSHSLESPEVMPEGIVFPDDLQHGHSLDEVELTQKHTLAVDDIAHTHSLESVSVVLGVALSVERVSHAHTLDGTGLSQRHLLAVSDVLHAQTMQQSSLTQKHVLAPADVSHVQSLDSVVTIAGITLSVQSISHAHFLGTAIVGLTVRPPGGKVEMAGVSKKPVSTSVVEARMQSSTQVPHMDVRRIGTYDVEDPNSPLVDDPLALVDDPVALAGRLVTLLGTPAPNAAGDARIKMDIVNTRSKGNVWQNSPRVSPTSRILTPAVHSRRAITQPGTIKYTPKSLRSPKNSARIVRRTKPL